MQTFTFVENMILRRLAHDVHSGVRKQDPRAYTPRSDDVPLRGIRPLLQKEIPMNKILLFTIISTLFACGGSSEPITLAAGFTAPNMVEGRAGGATDASGLGDDCIGMISSDPDHVVTLAAAMPNLRIYAKSGEDITLVVQKPDGTYLCNDDFEGRDPLVTMESFPAGTYKVWVGSYSTEDGGAAYKLGFSTDAAATPSQL